MESYKYLNEINKIPISKEYENKSFSEILNLIDNKKTLDCIIEAGFATEIGAMALFESRNVPDSMFEAYKDSFTNSDISLFEHYQEVLEKGDNAVLGFVNNLKGKVFEVELRDKLNELYEGYNFELAEKANQPIWDLKGINDFGEDILVQAKLWSPNSASKLENLMYDNPDVLYATGSQIRDVIIQKNPELADQFIDIDVDSYKFTEDVKENLELLVDNMGIDVPDGLGDVLPYISEIVFGLRLLMDLVSVQKDFKYMSATDKTKLSAVKVIVLLSRYGVTATCAAICSMAGGAIGGIIPGLGHGLGGTVGGITGSILSRKINKEIKPYMLELSLELVGLDKADVFYFQNKKKIDDLAASYLSISI